MILGFKMMTHPQQFPRMIFQLDMIIRRHLWMPLQLFQVAWTAIFFSSSSMLGNKDGKALVLQPARTVMRDRINKPQVASNFLKTSRSLRSDTKTDAGQIENSQYLLKL